MKLEDHAKQMAERIARNHDFVRPIIFTAAMPGWAQWRKPWQTPLGGVQYEDHFGDTRYYLAVDPGEAIWPRFAHYDHRVAKVRFEVEMAHFYIAGYMTETRWSTLPEQKREMHVNQGPSVVLCPLLHLDDYQYTEDCEVIPVTLQYLS